MKRPTVLKGESRWDTYVCNGCGYEYNPALGDAAGEIPPGTTYELLPEEWTCPKCAEPKTGFVPTKLKKGDK